MFGLGAPELILIGIVVLLLFGAKKIPELMRGLGSGIKEFKQAANGDASKEDDDEKTTKNNDKK